MAVTQDQLLSMQFITTSCSAVSHPQSTCNHRLYLKCFFSICCKFVVLGHFELTHSSFHSLFVHPPLFFSSALAQREGCFLSLVLGTDLITYLFSLSYSKLLWLPYFAENRHFPPSPPSVNIPSSLSLGHSLPHPPIDSYCMNSVVLLSLPKFYYI